MSEHRDKAVEAMAEAGTRYLQECDERRREESQRIFGYPGAHIPKCHPDRGGGQRRREIAAAKPHLFERFKEAVLSDPSIDEAMKATLSRMARASYHAALQAALSKAQQLMEEGG